MTDTQPSVTQADFEMAVDALAAMKDAPDVPGIKTHILERRFAACREQALADAGVDGVREAIVEEAEFLCARLREFEGDLQDDDAGRQYCGHVQPSLARLEAFLEAALASPAPRQETENAGK